MFESRLKYELKLKMTEFVSARLVLFGQTTTPTFRRPRPHSLVALSRSRENKREFLKGWDCVIVCS